MYKLLIKLMIIAALTELGISFTNPGQIQKASHEVLRVNWKPISVFPEEAKRFR